ncbi:flagellar biosynthesis protein FlgG [Helicobacter pylori]|uniref:flagellar biosynthesis protein FlgG n=1 Tax=Helicobacter pylori TaxID=210 RepID=UPI0013E2CEB8|nr:flagellar biosynthesis protein FlgG [Helicobacter pylori]
MEQLIEAIEANSGKFLHYETQQANKTNKMWYPAIIFLISLAILAVFFIKREHQPSNSQESDVQKT